MIMHGKNTLYLDQWGHKYWAKTVKELRAQIEGGGRRVSKLYRDKKDGSVVSIGYVVSIHSGSKIVASSAASPRHRKTRHGTAPCAAHSTWMRTKTSAITVRRKNDLDNPR